VPADFRRAGAMPTLTGLGVNACIWRRAGPRRPVNPNYLALKLFRNYDGAHHGLEATSVRPRTMPTRTVQQLCRGECGGNVADALAIIRIPPML